MRWAIPAGAGMLLIGAVVALILGRVSSPSPAPTQRQLAATQSPSTPWPIQYAPTLPPLPTPSAAPPVMAPPPSPSSVPTVDPCSVIHDPVVGYVDYCSWTACRAIAARNWGVASMTQTEFDYWLGIHSHAQIAALGCNVP